MQSINIYDLHKKLLLLEMEVNKLTAKITEKYEGNLEVSIQDDSVNKSTQLIIETATDRAGIVFLSNNNDQGLKSLGQLRTTSFTNQSNKFAISSGKEVSLELNADNTLSLFSNSMILLNSKNISIESESIDVSGELLAKIRYTGPFEWQSGQPKLRLIHKEDGFPVITRIKGDLKDGNNDIQLFIESKDNHWYLDGRVGKSQKMLVQVICIGKG